MGRHYHSLARRTLKDITLPGTHNSGAYELIEKVLPGRAEAIIEICGLIEDNFDGPIEEIIMNWSITQTQNLYGQLRGGIRYLDFRAGWLPSEGLWVTHHFLIGNPVETLLKDIKKFLDWHRKEVVVIELNSFEGQPDSIALDLLRDLVVQYLGNYLYPVDLEFEFTFRDMVRSGRRVIVTFEEGDYSKDYIWPKDSIFNTFANSDDLDTMMSFNQEKLEEFNSGEFEDSLYKISWTLTPDCETFRSTEVPGAHTGVDDLARTANPTLARFWWENQYRSERLGDILVVDFYERSPVVPLALYMNRLFRPRY